MKLLKWFLNLFRRKKPETFETLTKQIQEEIFERFEINEPVIERTYSLPEIRKMLSDEWKKPKGIRSYQTIQFCYDMKNKLKAGSTFWATSFGTRQRCSNGLLTASFTALIPRKLICFSC